MIQAHDKPFRQRLVERMNVNCAFMNKEQFYIGEFDRGIRGYFTVDWRARMVEISPPSSLGKDVPIDCMVPILGEMIDELELAVETLNRKELK